VAAIFSQQSGVHSQDSSNAASTFGQLTYQAAGLFIVLVGPDGVGKTSLAERIMNEQEVPTLYIHFRPSLFRRPPLKPNPAPEAPPKRQIAGSPPLGWLRLMRSIIGFWAGYLRWIRPATRRGALVVGDRWAYGYVGQPAALGFAGPAWLGKLGVRLAPRPDLLVRLKAPPSVVSARKKDLGATEIAREDMRWDALAEILPVELVEIDATSSLDSMAVLVRRLITNRRS
jgi:thymidylate kinase